MQHQFESFERPTRNHSAAWIPRVFSHLGSNSEPIPTNIDKSGLQILTSFAPWVASEMTRARTVPCRKSRKSNSFDSVQIATDAQEGVSVVERTSSNKSHTRSSSLPSSFMGYTDYLWNSGSPEQDQANNEGDRPLIKIGMAHSVMFEGAGLSMFTVYIIELESTSNSLDRKMVSKIKKRYSEFKDLYENLSKIYGIRLPVFPRKSVIGQFSSIVIQYRLQKFIQLLEFVLNNPVLNNSTLLLQFLNLNQEESIRDEKSDCSIESYTTAMQL